ncbi:MAG: hypothetical protein LQ351_002555 [Letrouitia transgressa]|nr:MAG: hypothetical protein LQ351_002555 [Letrouitia transgressa]
MPHRSSSPAVSEAAVDIASALFHDDQSSGSEDGKIGRGHRQAKLAPDSMPDPDDGGSLADDDASFIAEAQAAAYRKSSNLKGKSVKKGGGFQAMGLNANLLKAIARKGFSVPTPIQRKTIPLVLDGQDVVGMARTGSGKTAAFVLPIIEKLKTHSQKVGARALVMSPSRELALQTLLVVKEFAKGTDLRPILLVGGDSLEEQFGLMSTNPDIIIATPGRFLHLKVEMGLDLSTISFVVFDEADRLFEMGFANHLTEILHVLPQSRQTLLFSATLPKTLVEFAQAGLQEPNLVRLDTESKISPDLESAFFTVKSAETEGALLHVLNDIIKIPCGPTEAALKIGEESVKTGKKRKRNETDGSNPKESPTEYSTIIFAATKHHVEYLSSLLRLSGFAVSFAYGALDQVARKTQVQDFRTGRTHILVVTDVAARGIDIPVLANVVNYDFPSQPKIYVHRVGRTARAGQKGWSYSLVRESELPYALDLQLFLGRRFILGRNEAENQNYAEDVVVGSLGRDRLERACELVSKLQDEDSDLQALRSVASKAEKLYLKTRNSASAESVRRAKDLISSKSWTALHPLFNEKDEAEVAREKMLARVSGFRPQETVFEIGQRGGGREAAEVMKKRRATIEARKQKTKGKENEAPEELPHQAAVKGDIPLDHNESLTDNYSDMESILEPEFEVTVSEPHTSKVQSSKGDGWKDSEFFMSYTPTTTDLAENRAYGVHSGSNNASSHFTTFLEEAKGAAMDLNNDEGGKTFAGAHRPKGMRWDKKSKKYVARANDEDGSKGAKMIRGESGQKLAASFRSGRFDKWKQANRVSRLPRAGEAEKREGVPLSASGRRFKHRAEQAPKAADKYRDDYHKRKKKVETAKEKNMGRFKDGGNRKEVKGIDALRKQRGLKRRRREKNARPSKKSKV